MVTPGGYGENPPGVWAGNERELASIPDTNPPIGYHALIGDKMGGSPMRSARMWCLSRFARLTFHSQFCILLMFLLYVRRISDILAFCIMFGKGGKCTSHLGEEVPGVRAVP